MIRSQKIITRWHDLDRICISVKTRVNIPFRTFTLHTFVEQQIYKLVTNYYYVWETRSGHVMIDDDSFVGAITLHRHYLRYLGVGRRFHRFSCSIPFKTSSRCEQETSSRHWIPGQYERPPHQPQLNSTVSQLCSLRTRGAPSSTGVKSLCIIGRVHSSQGSFSLAWPSKSQSRFSFRC